MTCTICCNVIPRWRPSFLLAMTRSDAKRKATKKLCDAHYRASHPDPLRVIARYEAIHHRPASRHCEDRSNPDTMTMFLSDPLVCFVVPPRNDAKRRKTQSGRKDTTHSVADEIRRKSNAATITGPRPHSRFASLRGTKQSRQQVFGSFPGLLRRSSSQ